MNYDAQNNLDPIASKNVESFLVDRVNLLKRAAHRRARGLHSNQNVLNVNLRNINLL